MVSVSEVFKAWNEGFEKRTLVSWQSSSPTISGSCPRYVIEANKRHWTGLPPVATRRLLIIWKCCMRTMR